MPTALEVVHLEGVTLPRWPSLCAYCHAPMHVGAFETFADSFAKSEDRRAEHDRGYLKACRAAAAEVVASCRERNLDAAWGAAMRWHDLTINDLNSGTAWACVMSLRYGYVGTHVPCPLKPWHEAEAWRKLETAAAHSLRILIPFSARSRGVPDVCADELAAWDARA